MYQASIFKEKPNTAFYDSMKLDPKGALWILQEANSSIT